jgi:hypothetical protein
VTSLSDLGAESAYRVLHVAEDMLENFEGGAWAAAREIWEVADLDTDERVQVWMFLDSKQRAYLKGSDRKYLDDYYR